jgi:predicted MPP superfamily phosphohydrolase
MFHSSGRGRHYSTWRRLLESTLRIAYPFSWPARAWAIVPGATDVRLLRHRTKVAVLGNHDLWADHARLERALERAGAKVLIDDALRLPAPYDDVAILGTDEPWTGLPLVGGEGVRLLMCRHTHSGHIALPGPRPVIVPGPMGKS